MIKKISVINIYAPCNIPSERKEFFLELDKIVASCHGPVVVTGDFNCVIDPYQDRFPSGPRPDSSRKALKDLMDKYKLIDVWREKHPSKIQFTRTSSDMSSASRIDRFLISKELLLNVIKCEIIHYPSSDHDFVELQLDLTLIPRGPGTWIFNNSFLEDDNFCNDTRLFILDNWTNTAPSDPDGIKIWYDSMKEAIKVKCIEYGKRRKRKRDREKQSLIKKIDYEQFKAQKFADYDTTRLLELRSRLNVLLDHELNGVAIRSKVLWEEGEKSTKFFLNLESSRQRKKVVRSIITERGEIVTDQKSVLREQMCFYKKLYSLESTQENIQLEFLNHLDRFLSEEETQFCEEEINLEELSFALSHMKSNKSPGLDGLTVEFFKKFWDVLGPILLRICSTIYESSEMCESMKTGMISLIPKKGDLTRLSNWRPISLLNIDYKIITKALANRISKVISSIISNDQTCCIPGRDIADNIMIIQNVIRYVNENNRNGLILKIDQLKAFDRVNHQYLFRVLERVGFGHYFRNWIKILYTDIKSHIKHNGFLSDVFEIKRGVRQGCPISALLYVISAEPFREAIYKNANISGIKFLNFEARMFQHADDTTFMLANSESIVSVFETIKDYERASGSKCNYEKTELLLIGRSKSLSLNYPFPVRSDFLTILGVAVGNNDHLVEKENWDELSDSCGTVLQRWKGRKLSFKGKSLVVNALVASRFIYMATVVPVPDWVCDAYRKNVTAFMWGHGKPLINYDVLTLPVEKGGLNLFDLKQRRDALRLKIIGKIQREDINVMLKALLVYNFNQYENMNMGLQVLKMLPDPRSLRKLQGFIREMLLAWRKLTEGRIRPPSTREEILSQPLFHNHLLRDVNGKMFLDKSFISGGIVCVRDLMYEMLPRRIPNEAILELILLADPDSHLNADDVGEVIQEICSAFPDPWIPTILEGDSLVTVDSEKSFQLDFEGGKENDHWVSSTALYTKSAVLLLHGQASVKPKGEIYWTEKYPDLNFEKIWKSAHYGFKSYSDADSEAKSSKLENKQSDLLFDFRLNCYKNVVWS
ncbi:hypothetical protein HOLleu_28369 [Holothuria leucospilota]|uniref:Reverse transcriptase domain-containing protein n=1 Tax=Holothuria leucospilota TaxID=206669 RepID=A0A9Q1BLY3_HOLLE|nr:hypothetical protein HOLleu_28369 [Holothuria leucospilota]